jgi:peptide/nickel transport system ATP-binding protein
MTATDALVIENLNIVYEVGGRDRHVVSDLSFRIKRGEAYGLVGESGCGKSTAALAAIRYLARNGRVNKGRILIDGRDLMTLSSAELRQLRSHSVAMVYQDPGRALNPSLHIARQMTEVFEVSEGIKGKAAYDRALEMLLRVQIASPDRVMQAYPHELSGGMQQRVVIAMALSINPALLILDEPTTGLDATVEAEILDLVAKLRGEFSSAILFISHSLSVIAHMCDRVGVLYAGELIEEGPAAKVFDTPRHPYTVGLLRCIPKHGKVKAQGALETIPGFLPTPGSIKVGCVYAERCPIVQDICRTETPRLIDLDDRSSRCHFHELAPSVPHQVMARATGTAQIDHVHPVLSTRNLSKTFTVGGKPLQAVHDVTLDLWPSETLGLVGESGSGKSTLARLLLGLVRPDSGSVIELDGDALPARAKWRNRAQLKALQIVFQNPGMALNRSHAVRKLIGRALYLTGARGKEREDRLQALAQAMRLTAPQLNEKPRRLSGGLKQRVGIARAFAGEPKIVVCDEPTSALDVSVQAAILNLLVDLQAERQVSYILISHDLGVVNYLSDRVAVLYLGRLLEIGPAASVFAAPHHPYTEALVSASPSVGAEAATRICLEGEIPSATNLPSGCVFQTRCPRKIGPICEDQEPPLLDAGAGHTIRCHIPAAELNRLQSSAQINAA